MSSKAEELRAKLIRNFDEAPLTREAREPLYDGRGARLARGTAALKLGASIDILEPGKRCPECPAAGIAKASGPTDRLTPLCRGLPYWPGS